MLDIKWCRKKDKFAADLGLQRFFICRRVTYPGRWCVLDVQRQAITVCGGRRSALLMLRACRDENGCNRFHWWWENSRASDWKLEVRGWRGGILP